jgi:hypothetical protein
MVSRISWLGRVIRGNGGCCAWDSLSIGREVREVRVYEMAGWHPCLCLAEAGAPAGAFAALILRYKRLIDELRGN